MKKRVNTSIQYETASTAEYGLQRLQVLPPPESVQVQTDPHHRTFVLSSTATLNARLYQRRLYGRVTNTAMGGKIEARLKETPISMFCLSLWFGILGFIELITVVAVISSPFTKTVSLEVHPVFALAAPLAFALIGYGFLRFSQWLGRESEAAMTQHLYDTLPAIPVAIAREDPPA